MGSSGAGDFPSTLWSLVLSASGGAGEAMEQLARRYTGPVYAFIRSSGRRREDAEDLTQDFFAHILETRVLEKADPARGRFRSFLLAAVRNFLANEHDRRTAQKRGGGRVHISLDAERAEGLLEVGGPDDAPRGFDREWAVSMLSRALEALKADLSPRAAEVFALAEDPEAPSYKEIAARFDMTEGAVTATVHRARKRLRELLFAEARATVATDEEALEELRDLVKALGK